MDSGFEDDYLRLVMIPHAVTIALYLKDPSQILNLTKELVNIVKYGTPEPEEAPK